MDAENLDGRIARGGLTLILLRLTVRLLGLVSTMILFRVLVPDDFGLATLAAAVLGLVDVCTDFGLEAQLVRQDRPAKPDYDLIWTLSILRGVVIAVLLIPLAEPAAHLLHEPRLAEAIRWLAIVPVLDGFRNPGVIDFTRTLDFQQEFRMRTAQKLVSFCATLAMAFVLKTYWALILGVITGRATGLVLTYVMHPMRPRLSLSGWRGVVAFSVWVSSNNAITYIGSQADKLILQRRFDLHLVGLYRLAEEMCNVVLELIIPMEQALYAGFSRLSNDLGSLRRILLSTLGIMALVSLPISVGLMLISEPLLEILFGPKAAGAGRFMEVLVIYGAIRACKSGVGQVLMALGRPEIETRSTAWTMVVRIAALILALPYLGAMAAPWALVAGASLRSLLLWRAACALLQLAWREIIAVIWRPILGVSIMALLLPLLESSLFGANWDPNDWIQMGFRVIAGAAIYVCTVLLLWRIAGTPEGAEVSILLYLKRANRR